MEKLETPEFEERKQRIAQLIALVEALRDESEAILQRTGRGRHGGDGRESDPLPDLPYRFWE